MHPSIQLSIPSARLLGTPPSAASGPLLPKKARVLLAYLMLGRRPIRRSAILPLLWPAASEDRARGSLRVALHALRRTLGPLAIQADRHVVATAQLPPTDLQAFLDALRQGDDATAVALYGGPLLEDVTLYDTVEGDLWLEGERLRLARLFEAAARRLLQPPLSPSLPMAAQLAIAERLRTSDPRQVANWQLYLTRLARYGTPEQLARERSRLEARLAAGELDDTTAAHALLAGFAGKTIRQGPTGQSQFMDSRSLANRQAALGTLNSAWRHVAAGGGAQLLLTGQAGIGKSELLASFARGLRAASAPVVAVRISGATRDLPFACLREVVLQALDRPGALQMHPRSARQLAALDESLPARLGISAAEPWPSATPRVVAGLTRAVLDLLRQIATDTPTALLLDDGHWADPVSRRILRRAALAAQDVPLLLVVAARVAPGAAWLRWPRLHLLPLTGADARTLVRGMGLSALPDPVTEYLLARAGGVPLRLRHAVHLATEQAGWPRTACEDVPAFLLDETTWRVGPVATRLQALLSRAPDMALPLALLALWDAPLSAAALAGASERPSPTAPAPTFGNGARPPVRDDTMRARLLRLRDIVTLDDGDRCTLSHDRIGDAVRRVVNPAILQEAAVRLVRYFGPRATSRRDRHQLQRLAASYAATARADGAATVDATHVAVPER